MTHPATCEGCAEQHDMQLFWYEKAESALRPFSVFFIFKEKTYD